MVYGTVSSYLGGLLPKAKILNSTVNATQWNPIHDIPVEILGEIFVHCLPVDPLDTPQPCLSQAPLLLCHVSSLWRKVAFGMPILWSNLYHKSFYVEGRNAEVALRYQDLHSEDHEFLAWWSKRVGSHPSRLRLSLRTSKVDLSPIPSHISPDPLITLLSSTRHLEIDWYFRAILQDLQWFPVIAEAKKPYCLESLSFLGSREPVLRMTVQDLPFIGANGIRKAAINAIIPSMEPISQRLTPKFWNELTHLSLGLELGANSPLWPFIIRECINLEYAQFTFRSFSPYVPPSSSLGRVEIPKLRELIIKCQDSCRRSHHLLFDDLIFPSLTTLHVRLSPYGLSFRDLSRLLGATPALKNLQLDSHFPCEGEVWEEAFTFPSPLRAEEPKLRHHVPQLERLDVNWSEWMFQQLYLSLYVSHLEDCRWLSVESSDDSAPRLQFVFHLDVSSMQTDPYLCTDGMSTEIEKMKKQGVDVLVRFRNSLDDLEADMGGKDRWFYDSGFSNTLL